jgi:hypothetical protein
LKLRSLNHEAGISFASIVFHYCVAVACSWGGEAAVADESAATSSDTSTAAGAKDAAAHNAAVIDSTDANSVSAATIDADTDAATEANGSVADVAAEHTDAAVAAHSDAAAVAHAEAQPAADNNHTTAAGAAAVTKQLPAPGILRLRKLLLRSQDFAERLWRPRKEWTSVEAAIAAQQCRHLSRAVTASGALCRWLPVNTAVYLALLQWREQTAVSVLMLL